MIIFLYGPDSYRRIRKMKELMFAYQKKHGKGDFLSVDLEENEEDWRGVRDFLGQQSIFVDKKITIVREATNIKEKEWIDLIKSHSNTSDVFLLISDKKKPPAPFSFLLKEPVKSQAFNELEKDQLKSFILKEAKERSFELSILALELLCGYASSFAEGRSWVVIQELEKISSAGFSQPILVEDLQKFIDWAPEGKLFNEVTPILGPYEDLKKLVLLEKLFLRKEEPAYIFNLLGFKAKGDVVEKLADYDVSIKSGGLDYETALIDLVIAG